MIRLNLIVCATKTNGIGTAGKLPWRLKEDMNFFKYVTSLSPSKMKNVVIMGRKTWESIPVKFRPLSNRINIIVSRRLQQSDAGSLGIDEKQDSYLVDSIDSACLLIRKLDHPHDINPQTGVQNIINKVFVIGGSEIYRSVLDEQSTSNFAPSHILITRILSDHPSIDPSIDTFFPEFRSSRRQNWCKSVDLIDQNKFLCLPQHQKEGGDTGDMFRFDHLVIDRSFLYKFELWINHALSN
ncbi:dihydrofolate reductase [Puccinia striiformis f. sp. tritici PST-78]|uniref:Dihydrofolate reductase n=1 Tax=Puccinia striiformis f. sp. tritici PST-78 TaxID=1165861 RepID=A0A0L0V8F6_9BASI|nr:dihydrofolate reductase [Puccinia striiformis f. sp. tritici PST-78]